MKKKVRVVLIWIIGFSLITIGLAIGCMVGVAKPLQKIEAVEPTCVASGNMVYYKNMFGVCFADESGTKSYDESFFYLAPTGEHSVLHHADLAATCTKNGNIEYWECSVCNQYFADEECKNKINETQSIIEALGHEKSHYSAIEVTCTENGRIEYWECSRCEKLFSDENCNNEIEDYVIEAKGHSSVFREKADAACTEDGSGKDHWRCTNCAKLFFDEGCNNAIPEEEYGKYILEALGHVEYYYESVEATCTESGNIEYWYCMRCEKCFYEKECNNVISENGHVKQALGHDIKHYSTKNATCTEYGRIEYWHCERCDKDFSDESYNTEIQDTTGEEPKGHYYDVSNKCLRCDLEWKYTDKLEYTLNSDKMSYSVTGIGASKAENIVLPFGYNNKLVTSIGEFAFKGNDNIKSFFVTDNITKIEEYAFYGCRELTSLTIGNGVVDIGDSALENCIRLERISVAADNETYHVADNSLIETESKSVIAYFRNREWTPEGTAENPYLIENAMQFAELVNASDKNAHYQLMNSIDLGNWNNPFEFSGNLNGNGYTISYRQQITTEKSFYGGLFTKLENSTVENLCLYVSIYRNKDIGGITGNVGALAGQANGVNAISKIKVSGTIWVGDYSGKDHVGGVIGELRGGTVEQCVNYAKITCLAMHTITGGIIGFTYPTDDDISITNCYNTGDLESSSNYTTAYGGRSSGGIVGQVRCHKAFSTDFEYCYGDSVLALKWTGVATGGWWAIGGIFGDVWNGEHYNLSLKNSYWNSAKHATQGGTNASYHSGCEKIDMTGIYKNWSSEIWKFSITEHPKLKWEI